MERQLATIQKIEEIKPIEGADKIHAIRIKDWWVVAQKEMGYKVGDLVIYFEIDSFLPDIEIFSFLKKGSSLKRMTIENEIKVGIRLKTIKLRGQISQGLIMPTSILTPLTFGYRGELTEGSDVSPYLGVIKWEAPIPSQLAGKAKGFFPSFIPKTDEERIQNMRSILNGFYVTEKLDGSSVTYFKKDGVFGVCSRNLELLETEGNTQWRLAREMDLENKLPDGFAIQGELVGEGIQKNPLGLIGQKVFFYNVYKIEWTKYLDYEDMIQFLVGLGVSIVPVLDTDYALPKTVEEILTYAEGRSSLNPNVEREGVVIRSKNERPFNGQRTSFKAISNRYLLGTDGD